MVAIAHLEATELSCLGPAGPATASAGGHPASCAAHGSVVAAAVLQSLLMMQ